MRKYILLFLGLFFIGCANEVLLWPGGEIEYCYASSFTSSEKKIIESAMRAWETTTDKPNKPYVYFTLVKCDVSVLVIYRDNNENFATFGYQEISYMNLSSICYSVVAHELGHVIGLMHEHQRPDRDSYITINYNNVIESYRDQFYKMTSNYWKYDYKKYAYDYNSIMHYSRYAFTSNGKLTIVSPVPIINSEISDMDYAKVKDMYTADVYED